MKHGTQENTKHQQLELQPPQEALVSQADVFYCQTDTNEAFPFRNVNNI